MSIHNESRAIHTELVREAKSPAPWWRDLRNVAELCEWLEREGRLPTDRWEVLKLADRYTPEWEEFKRHEARDHLADEAEAAEDEEWRDMQRRAAL